MKIKKTRVTPGKLEGELDITPSKSLAHRAIIAASLSKGRSNISNISFSEDIQATIEGMKALGAKIERTGQASLRIQGGYLKGEKSTIDARESGSTLRFLIPIASLEEGEVTFKAHKSLQSRPIDPYFHIFHNQGIKYETGREDFLLKTRGKLKAGNFEIRGDISSQFITGLLFTLPLLEGDSRVKVVGNLESKAYVDLTIDILGKFGIRIENNRYKEFKVQGSQEYKAQDYRVEGDFSQAAFWIVAGVLGGDIRINDTRQDSLQGDRRIVEIVKRMGGDLEWDGDSIIAKKSKTFSSEIDGSECPDLVPILTVLASLNKGETRIKNVARLRIKESNRLEAISTELNKIGGDVREEEDDLVIKGKMSFTGGRVDSWNDHRIAMSLAIASIRSKNPIIISNSSVVKKSYIGFWDDFKALGGGIDEFHMGQ